MLAMPVARGLFRKAITQSAAGAWVSTRERAATVAQRTIDRLGVRAGDIDALRAIPKERLLAAGPDLSEEAVEGIAGLPWQPVIDGAVLFEFPRDAIAAGSAGGVHLLTGTNARDRDPIHDRQPRWQDGGRHRPRTGARSDRRQQAPRVDRVRARGRPGEADLRQDPPGHHALRRTARSAR